MDDQDAINQFEWENPGNWLAGIFYRGRRDTRLLVPKRSTRFGPFVQSGQTINFSHRNAGWMMLGLSLVPLGFLLLFVLIQLSK